MERTPVSLIGDAGHKTESSVLGVAEGILENEALSCRYAGKSRLCDYYFQRRKNQQFFSFEYIYSGENYVRCGKNAYIAEAGEICILPMNKNNDLLHLPGKECRKAGIIPVGSLLPEIVHTLKLDCACTVRFETSLWKKYFNRISNEMKYFARTNHRRCLSGIIFELLVQISEEFQKQTRHPKVMEEIKRRFDEHFAEPFKMSELAAQCQMSLPTFNHLFSECFHQTPYQYLLQIRHRKAEKLLRETQLTIKEICFLVGYGNPFHFSAEFTRFHGCSPSKFRKKVDWIGM